MTILIGAGAHGKDIVAIWNRNHHEPLSVYDHDPRYHCLPTRATYDERCYVGINDPQERARIVTEYFLDDAPPLIDRDAIVGSDCSIAGGCVIAPHATLLTDVWLGRHVHVNYNASMTRCIVGRFTTVSPGVTICGNVTIGNECFIGADATICDRVTIGHSVTIGAGATVLPLSVVPDGATVIGVWKDA